MAISNYQKPFCGGASGFQYSLVSVYKEEVQKIILNMPGTKKTKSAKTMSVLQNVQISFIDSQKI
jgi:hypothetical protein